MRRKNCQILAIAVIALMMVSAVQAATVITAVSRSGTSTYPVPVLYGTPLAVGQPVMNNRGFTYTAIPASLIGADSVQLANEERHTTAGDITYSLTLAKQADVYLLIDWRVGDNSNTNKPTLGTTPGTVMYWVTEMGYVDTGEKVNISDTQAVSMQIYKKTFPAGTHLVGREQHDGGTRNNYAIAAVVSKANNASNPRPANKATMVAIDTVLAWDAPANPEIDLNLVKYYMFMDPNETKVSTSDENNNLCSIYSGEMLKTLTFDPSPTGTLPNNQKYYWKVNTKFVLPGKTDPNVFGGSVWSFTTAPLDSAPIANAGNSIITWLAKAQSGTVQLAGSVTDLESDATTSWTAYRLVFGTSVPATEVIFANQTPTTTVTISTEGDYILKLTATDDATPPQTSSSQMKITVYADACTAAKKNPAVTYIKNVYDFDDDCQVEIDDLLSIAGKWLNSTAATTDTTFTETVGNPLDGGLVAEYWTNITGTDPNSLLNDPRYPASPTGSDFITGQFKQTGRNMDYYGQRIRGYIVAPTTGSYIFYISTDDNSRLFLSTDTNPANAVMIAYSGYTAPDDWIANLTQKSAPRSLTAGQYYYVEVIMKEGTGTDYVSVAWSTDGGTTKTVIPGTALRWFLP